MNTQQAMPTAPMPYVPVPSKFYTCIGTKHIKMHRPDGVPIIFLNGLFEAVDKYTINYLDAEIDSGLSAVREATEEEISAWKFSRDPVGHTSQQIQAQLEQEFDHKLQKLLLAVAEKTGTPVEELEQIKNTLAAEGDSDLNERLAAIAGSLTGAQTPFTGGKDSSNPNEVKLQKARLMMVNSGQVPT